VADPRPPISQAMIDAYDAYTHVTLDRRGLIARLTTLAGSTAAAYAVLPLLEASQAKAAIIAADDKRLTTSEITWPAANGETMRGYLALPTGKRGRLPAVLVIHENRGLNVHIRDVARRAALAGFASLAPDFLSPHGGTPADEDKAREMIGKLDRERAIANGVATIDFLRQHPRSNGKVGAVGFCWGGGMTNALAVAAGSKLQAAAPFYGPAPADLSKVPQIEAKMQLHYAGVDERINANLPAYKAALEAANVDHQLFIYEGKQHAFHNDTSAARYDKAAAELAWGRVVEFFRKTLV
jgi:carboxymethylenebutenolidase